MEKLDSIIFKIFPNSNFCNLFFFILFIIIIIFTIFVIII